MAKSDNRIQVECTIQKIRFYKNGWGIISASIDKVNKGELLTDYNNTIFKGDMPSVKEGEAYKISGTYVEDAKWGGQYNIDMITSNITLDDKDTESQKKFLLSIFTPKQVENMYKALEDPYTVLKNEDALSLTKVRGCGLYTAPDWILRFQQNYHRARIYSELDEYNLSSSIIDKLIERYKSPDVVIEKIKTNPYVLITEVKGIGWAIADKIALAGGLGEFSTERIGAFLYQYLYDAGEDGFSWVTPDEIMGILIEKFGNDIPDTAITDSIYAMEDKLWWNEDKSKIGLKYYYDLEHKIAEELLRIRNAECSFDYSEWEDAISRIEYLQGWEYTDEQKNAIKKALDETVILIQGGAGTGKSSVVRAILEALKTCSFVQCALSGKAASRLMEVTEQEGFTIHRLLGYPKGESDKQKFLYHDENQLEYDLYILDEISMVDLKLFYYLLRAIPSGSKLILLGDNGQLEAIGSGNIAYDMLISPEIASVTLNKIHRQAENSAIVTESVKIRKGQQIVEKDWAGCEVRGNMKDFEIIGYSDKSNTYYKIMEYFSRVYEQCKDINAIQVIVPTKQKGASTYMLNNAIQELYNPNQKKEVYIQVAKDKGYYIRVGDKVINTKNNYKTDPNIYNGNVGIVQDIYYDQDLDLQVMDIYFEGIGLVSVVEDYWKGIELGYALTTHKCVTEDTYIYTNKGLMQIGELNNEANVFEQRPIIKSDIKVFNGENYETPTHFYNAGVNPCISISTKRGISLTGTLDHGINILNEKGEFERKNLIDIKEGDYVVIRKGQKIYGDYTDLPDDWYDIKTDVRTIIYELPKKMTGDFAQFLGHMVADGVITDHGFRIHKNQKEVIDEVNNIIIRLFDGVNTKVQHLKQGPYGGMWIVEVSSKQIKDFLQKIGGIQPHNKYVPECILMSNEECQCRFLRGLFEDGSVRVKKNNTFDYIQFSQRHLKPIQQVQYMLLNLGIITSFKVLTKKYKDKNGICNPHYSLYIYKDEAKKKKKKIGFISYNKQKGLQYCEVENGRKNTRISIKVIRDFVMSFLEEIGYSHIKTLSKCYANFKAGSAVTFNYINQILNAVDEIGDYSKHPKYQALKKIASGDYYFDPVVKIAQTKMQTYCITMPETHQFVQNGIIGWNCQGSQADYVIFGLDFNAYTLLSKELVYTGITRAKKKCYLICETNALRYATGKSSVRVKQTHLQQCLHDIAHPVVVF